MYIPKINRMDDQDEIFALMEANSFATVVTVDEAGLPFATHMPIVLDKGRGQFGTLVSHMARANPQWKHFAYADEILVIFGGPHAYISPSWYAGDFNVPTWNYMAVHAYGKPNVVEDEATLQQMLTDLIAVNEKGLTPEWSVDWSDERNVKMLKAIVGFEMEITRLEGKSKLNQNKTVADQQGVIAKLEHAPHATIRQVAVEMEKNLAK